MIITMTCIWWGLLALCLGGACFLGWKAWKAGNVTEGYDFFGYLVVTVMAIVGGVLASATVCALTVSDPGFAMNTIMRCIWWTILAVTVAGWIWVRLSPEFKRDRLNYPDAELVEAIFFIVLIAFSSSNICAIKLAGGGW